MKNSLRIFLAVLAGLVLAFVLVIGVEMFSSVVYPPPQGFTGTHEEMCLHVANYPPWILGVAGLMWVATAFVSTWLAARIGNRPAGIVSSLILGALLLSNIAMLPYTMWFKVAMPIGLAVGCFLGVAFGAKSSRTSLSTTG